MITLNKRLVTASVVIAAAAAVLSTLATAGSQPTPSAVVAQRYSSEFAPTTDPAGRTVDYTALARQAAAALEELKKKQRDTGVENPLQFNGRPDCQQQTWPNIAAACLITVNGTPVRQPARYISTDRAKTTPVTAL